MRVTLAQISATTSPTRNLALVERAVATAKADGSRLVVLPEATMKSFEGTIVDAAETLDGPWPAAVRAMAERADVCIVVGMFTPAEAGRVHNTLLITGGGVEAHYDKIHMYDALGITESRTVAPGKASVVFELDGAKVGVATCFDIRFPYLFQELADKGATVIVVPASWASGPGKVGQWSTLVRARALDSTAYLVACDQAGPPGATGRAGRPLGVGRSVVVDPFGESLLEMGAHPAVHTVDLDLDRVRQARESMPVIEIQRRARRQHRPAE